jgi:hypothetical protein
MNASNRDGLFFRLGPNQLPETRELAYGTRLQVGDYKTDNGRFPEFRTLEQCINHGDKSGFLNYLGCIPQPTSRFSNFPHARDVSGVWIDAVFEEEHPHAIEAGILELKCLNTFA